MVMEQQGLGSCLPIIQRLDRVERLVQFLEEKKSLSGAGRESSVAQWKTLSSALEEVHYKGTLLERLEMMEKRVLQLQLELSTEMEMVKKLTSSCSTNSTPSEKLEHSTISNNSNDHSFKLQENTIEVECGRNSQVSEKSKMRKRSNSVTCRKKWIRWLNLKTCVN